MSNQSLYILGVICVVILVVLAIIFLRKPKPEPEPERQPYRPPTYDPRQPGPNEALIAQVRAGDYRRARPTSDTGTVVRNHPGPLGYPRTYSPEPQRQGGLSTAAAMGVGAVAGAGVGMAAASMMRSDAPSGLRKAEEEEEIEKRRRDDIREWQQNPPPASFVGDHASGQVGGGVRYDSQSEADAHYQAPIEERERPPFAGEPEIDARRDEDVARWASTPPPPPEPEYTPAPTPTYAPAPTYTRDPDPEPTRDYGGSDSSSSYSGD